MLRRYYPASSLLWAPPRPSRLPPISWVLQLYGFLAPPISRRDEEGFSSCFACPCHRAVAYTPPEWIAASVRCDHPCCLHRTVAGSASGATHFRGHICVHFRYGPMAHCHPKEDLVDRLQRFSFLPPCYPSYEASDFCPGGTHLPLNTPAFAGHAPSQCRFPACFFSGI